MVLASASRPTGTNVNVLQGDGTQLPFDTGRFSSAASFTMLHHVPSAYNPAPHFGQNLKLPSQSNPQARHTATPGEYATAEYAEVRSEVF